MNDPFRMIPVRESPGRDCGARGRAGTIDFIAPGRGDAAAEFLVAEALLDEVRSAPADGRKYPRRFETGITAPDGSMIARVRKPLPVRQKRGQPPRD